MSGSSESMQQWIDAAVKAMAEVSTSLGLAEPELVKCRPGLPGGVAGSSVAMIGKEPFQIGVFSDATGCQMLGRALLGMDESEQVAPNDLADALNEIVNMIAGVMKRHVSAEQAQIKLGLPVFIEGRIVDGHREATVAELKMGDSKTELMVLQDNSAAG